jgi:hypothetical protein
MQTYHCSCGNRIFFENTLCVVCQKEIGWCEACSRMTSLEPIAVPALDSGSDSPPTTEFVCGHVDCSARLRKCHNYAVENICNRCYVVDPSEAQDEANTPHLCYSCQLTETIPDLSVVGNREKWARLEAAKRRLLYTLDRIGLPYHGLEPELSFDFKADIVPPNNEWRKSGAKEIVYTGHAAGKITINIREADDAAREQLRVQFHEAQRTLIGHFHHEIGHYYWETLVAGKREREFIKAFGDHNSPPYAEAMAAYYQNGPRTDWPLSFISAYASAHPWEDFAETFALYLDMISVLDTASHLFKSIRANFRSRNVTSLVERYQEFGVLVNEFNRTVGLIDLVPEVVVAPVVGKLEFIHTLLKRAAKPAKVAVEPSPLPAPEPAILPTS